MPNTLYLLSAGVRSLFSDASGSETVARWFALRHGAPAPPPVTDAGHGKYVIWWEQSMSLDHVRSLVQGLRIQFHRAHIMGHGSDHNIIQMGANRLGGGYIAALGSVLQPVLAPGETPAVKIRLHSCNIASASPSTEGLVCVSDGPRGDLYCVRGGLGTLDHGSGSMDQRIRSGGGYTLLRALAGALRLSVEAGVHTQYVDAGWQIEPPALRVFPDGSWILNDDGTSGLGPAGEHRGGHPPGRASAPAAAPLGQFRQN
jgi:hypothetical protein